MSTSYARNIERLKANQRQVSAQEQAVTSEEARLSGQARQRAAQDWQKLTPFSNALQEWKKKDIEKKKLEGIAEARKAKLDKAKWLNENGSETAKKIYAIEQAKAVGELAFEFEDAKAQDLEYHKLKELLLKQGGSAAYPDADRITQLSPWQQVGFAQEQIRSKMLGFEEQLAHSMQNGTEPISLGGITYTAEEIRDNNLAFPMKQAAIEVYADKIYTNLGLDRYSDEMIKLSGVNETIQKAKDSQLGKYRERYNIESSMNTRQRAKLEWSRSEKTAVDLQHLLLKTSNTADTKGNLLGRSGGWKEVESILTQEGIARHNPEYAETVLNQPMPASMAKELGVKPGKTFAEQWPGKVKSIKAAIRKGYVDQVNEEEKYLQAAGTDKKNEFIQEARENPEGLTSQRVDEYKREFGKLGLKIPDAINKYETASMRDQREDEALIDKIMATNNGRITREQAQSLNPMAVHSKGLWDKIDKWEKSDLKLHDAENKIKAHLDTAFTNMGIKGNEKSPAYVEAMANAKADYAQKYNRYIAMGYSSEDASHHALHSTQVTDRETGEVIPDSMGVLAEIRSNGEGSKYVITGQSVEQSLKPGHIRVARIRSAKDEILNDPYSPTTKVIGGDYGHRQITSIANNVDKFGRLGIFMDPGALQYYKGIARGRNVRQGGWWGLIDAQLKATGHKGLNPAERPKAMELLTGEDSDGNTIPDPRGSRAVDNRVSRAMQYPSQQTSLYAMNTLQDGQRFGRGVSVFDQSDNLPFWYNAGGAV